MQANAAGRASELLETGFQQRKFAVRFVDFCNLPDQLHGLVAHGHRIDSTVDRVAIVANLLVDSLGLNVQNLTDGTIILAQSLKFA